MKRKRAGLLSDLKTAGPRRVSFQSRWEDKLAPDVRRELDEVKAALRAGEIAHSIQEVYEAARERFGLSITVGAFKDYLKR